MPFSSKAQARYMFAVHPKLAREFAQKTKSMQALPERVHHERTKEQEGEKKKQRPVVPKVAA